MVSFFSVPWYISFGGVIAHVLIPGAAVDLITLRYERMGAYDTLPYGHTLFIPSYARHTLPYAPIRLVSYAPIRSAKSHSIFDDHDFISR